MFSSQAERLCRLDPAQQAGTENNARQQFPDHGRKFQPHGKFRKQARGDQDSQKLEQKGLRVYDVLEVAGNFSARSTLELIAGVDSSKLSLMRG